jgi:beta-phosphoglucomutase
MNPSFQAVIFDLDGVLTDTARYHYLAWKHMAQGLGIEIDETFNESLKGIDRMMSLERILQHGQVQLPREEKERLAHEKNEHYKELIASMTHQDLLPGALERLDELKSLGVKISLASASRNAPTILEALGITGYFDSIANPALVAHGKPAPDIFLLAAASLHARPEACLGVEDAEAGVTAIKAAGMQALGVGDPKILAEADRVVAGLDAFRFAELFADWPLSLPRD